MFETLKLSDNSKVKFKKDHLNTFGLTNGPASHGGTCPGATTGKGGCFEKRNGLGATCYVDKLRKMYKNTNASLQFNTDLLKDKNYEQLVEILNNTMLKFMLNGGNSHPYFRLAWSGDFFSPHYALAWLKVIKDFPQVQFWAYTRSFNCVPFFAGVNNISLYISADPDNKKEALELFEKYKQFKNIGIAFMGNDAPKDYKWVTCPETSKKIKNTPGMGSCAKCRLCIDNYNDRLKNIRFNIH